MVHAKELLTELDIAISADDSLKQWNLINQLRKLHVDPPNKVIELLKLNTIHPVVKTTIFNWLKEIRYDQEVEVVKFNQYINLKPAKSEGLTNNLAVNYTMLIVWIIEENIQT